LFEGQGLVIVRASRRAGALALSAAAPGLEAATVTITTRQPPAPVR